MNSSFFYGRELNFNDNYMLNKGSGIYLGNNSDNSSFYDIKC